MVRGLALLFGFQFIGSLLAELVAIPVPGNVAGMLLLVGAFACGAVKLAWVEEAAELLLANLALLFVPAGVGVMVYFELLQREWLPIVVATVVSTFVVIAVTGWTAAWLEKRGGTGGA